MNYVWLTINGKLQKLECGVCRMWKQECADHKASKRLHHKMAKDTKQFLQGMKRNVPIS